MSERYSPSHRRASSERHIDRRQYGVFMRSAAVLSAISAVLVSPGSGALKHQSAPELSDTTYTKTMVAYGEPIAADVFDDMVIASVDDPSDEVTPLSSNDYLAADFTDAILGISSTLDGVVNVPKSIPVVNIDASPTGKHIVEANSVTEGATVLAEQSCYTHDDLQQIHDQAVAKLDLDKAAVKMPIVLQAEAAFCLSDTDPDRAIPLAHVVNESDAENYGVYNFVSLEPDTPKGVRRDLRSEIHEAAHVEPLGLPHALAVAPDGDKFATSPSGGGAVDISKLVTGDGPYRLATRKSGHSQVIDEYAASTTVMGQLTPSQHGDVFNFMEINQLNSEASRLQKIDVADERSYELSTSTDDDAVRGIVFDLPSDHPLRSLDGVKSQLKTMALGLNSANGDDMATLEVIGRLENGTTVTFNLESYIPTFDYERGEVVVYTDKTLGIQVTAHATKPIDGAKDSEVTLQVSALPVDVLEEMAKEFAAVAN